MQPIYLAPTVIPVTTVRNPIQLEREAYYWLSGRFTLRWSYDTLAKRFDGFEVIGEGGIQARVSLSDRSAS